MPVNIPSLHEHYEDIPELLEYYVNQFIEMESLPYRKFSVSAQNRLRGYKWPGNESELKNLVQRLLILGTEEIINIEEIESYLGKTEIQQKQYNSEIFNLDLPLRDARENFEKDYLTSQLKKFGGNISKTAKFVGMERSALHRKLKGLGVKDLN